MKVAPVKELRELIVIVNNKLAHMPSLSTAGGPEAYHKAVSRALAELRAEVGARVNEAWDGCSLRIGGISTTCTSGGAGAMRNWINAAERRIVAAEGRAA